MISTIIVIILGTIWPQFVFDILPDVPLLYFNVPRSAVDLSWNSNSTVLAVADGDNGISFIDVGTKQIVYRLIDEIYFILKLQWVPNLDEILIVQNITDRWNYQSETWLRDQTLPNGLGRPEYLPLDVDWNPNGKLLSFVFPGCALPDGSVGELSPGVPGARVEVWDQENQSIRILIPCIASGRGIIQWDTSGTLLAIYTGCDLSLWHLTTLLWTQSVDNAGKCEQKSLSLAWSNDSQEIAIDGLLVQPLSITATWTVEIYSAASGELVHSIFSPIEPFHRITVIDWHPSEEQLVVGDENGWLSLWNSENGILLQTILTSTDIIMDAEWSPNGCYLATALQNGDIYVWQDAIKDVLCNADEDFSD